MTRAATGFATGSRAQPELAAAAVRQALQRAGAELATSVLLLLTPHFARQAQAAVTAASRAARCLQVAGCTAPGVFTESEVSLDAPAAAALVLCHGLSLSARTAGGDPPLLTLATPAGIDAAAIGPARFGLLSTDAEAEQPGCVWVGAKIAADGRCEVALDGARLALGVSRGLRALSPPLQVTEVDGHEIFELGGEPALDTLRRELPTDLRADTQLPLSQLFAALPDPALDPAQAFAQGRYGLMPIVNASAEERSVTLAAPVPPGRHLFWALRQPAAAEADTAARVEQLAAELPTPDYALLLACIGRGPYFFGGEDRDLACLRERFPALPVLGGYGAGEIAPLAGGSALISYSAVLALAGHVQS